jgi:hypothetical protein
MKRRFKMGIIFIFLASSSLLSSDKISIKLIDKFYLEQKNDYIGSPQDIAVDEEENIFVSDPKLHNIKMYDKKGHLVMNIGQKGAGPGEFESPWTIDYGKGKLCVQDVGLKKYIILSKDLNKEFKEIKRFFYLVDGHKFIIQDDKIISDDYFIDKNGQDFSGTILDFNGKVLKALMPIPFSKNDGWNRVTSSKSVVDVSEQGDIYFVKAREVKLYKFSRDGNLIKEFGQNPSYFRPCKITKDFEKAVFTQDPDRGSAWERWYSSFSWVSGIFVLDDFLGIVIRNFDQELKRWECHLQFYDLDGNLLEDGLNLKETGTSSNQGFFLDSNHKDMIYILEMIEKEEPVYRFYKYRVERK